MSIKKGEKKTRFKRSTGNSKIIIKNISLISRIIKPIIPNIVSMSHVIG